MFQIFYGHRVKLKPTMLFFAVLAVVILPMVCLTGCAPAEEDADSVADATIKGLSGQGTLTSDKPMKDSFGSEYR